jgi:MATE family multidrug resistance protein
MVLSGTLNAIGRQSTVASFNLFSYYVVGLPFGLYMAKYHDWGLIGVWSGVAVAGLVKIFGEALVITLGINWEKECIKAEKRIDNQELI